jgi:AcrR family transcriptional regulator
MVTKLAKQLKAQQSKPETLPEENYNLLGQRLGRKGQETRERILTAALRLIESSADSVITLSAVAREVSVRMPNLYRYFPDLGELVLACLKRVMDTADEAYMDRLRVRWAEESLEDAVLDFLRAHHRFWQVHTRILHMRNSLADAGDQRFVEYRYVNSRPIAQLLIGQMDGEPSDADAPCADVATVVLTSFERLSTVITNPPFPAIAAMSGVIPGPAYVDRLLKAEAMMIALAIRQQRMATSPAAQAAWR